MSGTGGVSVRAGPSPNLEGRRVGLRRAQRRALRRTAGTDPLDPDEAGFICALVCGTCGRLTWPHQTSTPHRRDETALVRPEPCPHCDDRNWIDLRSETHSAALVEQRVGMASGASRSRRVLGVSAHTVGGMAAATLLAVLASTPLGWTLVAAALGASVGALAARQQLRFQPRRVATLPARWSLALPPRRAEAPIRGAAIVRSEPLVAPLSGRPCVAYELGLRTDTDADGPLASWFLLEQHIADIEIDGRAFEGRRLHLQLAREYQGHLSTLDPGPAFRIHLRQRGLGLAMPAMQVYESIVAPAASVVVEPASDEAGVGVLRPA